MIKNRKNTVYNPLAAASRPFYWFCQSSDIAHYSQLIILKYIHTTCNCMNSEQEHEHTKTDITSSVANFEHEKRFVKMCNWSKGLKL